MLRCLRRQGVPPRVVGRLRPGRERSGIDPAEKAEQKPVSSRSDLDLRIYDDMMTNRS